MKSGQTGGQATAAQGANPTQAQRAARSAAGAKADHVQQGRQPLKGRQAKRGGDGRSADPPEGKRSAQALKGRRRSGGGDAFLRRRPLRTGRASHLASGSSHSSAPGVGTE